MIRRQRMCFVTLVGILGLVAMLAGCASPPVDSIELMPAPEVYGDGLLNPLPETNPFSHIPYDGILFATDRAPASSEDEEKYYLNERGQVVRLGLAEIEFGKKEFTWQFARQVSLLKARTEEFPVKISNVEEWGIMGSTIPYWFDRDLITEDELPEASQRFAQAINEQLSASGKKHVYIYVHGFKVTYENPILVSAELWHFLGYEGAFIAYAWPSTPSKFAYIKDSDTSGGFARNFRLLLEFVAQNTDVEEIHVIAYSNGTRLVTRAMEQLALKYHGMTASEIWEELHLRNVILVGSDLDRAVFGSYMADGLLNMARHTSVYMSRYDKALGVSQFLTRKQRLGQLWGGSGGEINPLARKALVDYGDQISFINVSDAEGSDHGNGHGYFRSSPWASSDVLMTIYYGLTPEQRGLVEHDDMRVFSFPPDYIARLWASIEKVDPEFAESLRALESAQSAGPSIPADQR